MYGFHGGGLTSGNRHIPEQLKNQNIAVVAVNYRLGPKAVCPDYIDDAAASIAWVFKNIQNYGGDNEPGICRRTFRRCILNLHGRTR